MAANRFYSNTAVETALSSGINNSTTSMTVASTSGFPVSYPFTLVIDEGEPTEELVEVSSAIGTTLTVVRGVDNTSAATHPGGAVVKHVVSARDYREPQEHIDATDGVHGVTGDVVGTSDAQTLSNKSIDLTDNTLTGTLAEFSAAVSDADLVGVASTQTLTNKTIDLTDNTLVGTLAEFSAAVSDADLVGVATTQTLTGKTLTSPTLDDPVLTGSMTGTGSIGLSGSISADTSGGEIILGYSDTGGLSIANGNVATHPNGVVLWVDGTTLKGRKPNGTDVTYG